VVETITKLSEVAIEMLIAHAMVHTTDIALDIGNERMNPGQNIDGVSAISHHDRLMGTRMIIKDAIGTPSIGTDQHSI